MTPAEFDAACARHALLWRWHDDNPAAETAALRDERRALWRDILAHCKLVDPSGPDTRVLLDARGIDPWKAAR